MAESVGAEKFERLYEVMKSDKTGLVPMARFLKILYQSGLRSKDPRLRKFFQKLKAAYAKQLSSSGNNVVSSSADAYEIFAYEACPLSKDDFIDCVKAEEQLIFRALTGEFVIPEFDHFCKTIKQIYEKCRLNTSGKVANYIPQLARFDPNLWAVSICTVDGQRYSLGDSKTPFCLQSGSKALTYALALNEKTMEEVHEHVGQEPSGRHFNSLTLNYQKRPHNPMINSGCIATISLIKTEWSMADRFDYIQREFKRVAGDEYVGFSNATFLSERETADRNFALGYYMQENKVFPKEAKLKDTMDLYFQLCSIEVTAESASVMAATLANGGICPLNGDHVLKSDAVRNTLSLMNSCGMNDYSGQFAFNVGLPAKSGVSGVIILVVPNVMGICAWSPPLDESSNSARGIQFCEELVKTFNFHNYDCLTRHSKSKYDPRRTEVDDLANEMVTLLTNAVHGDVSALRRFRSTFGEAAMNQSDYDGRTALHLAAAEGQIKAVEFLLKECKVNPEPRDRFGGTPLDDARLAGREDIAGLIRSFIHKPIEEIQLDQQGQFVEQLPPSIAEKKKKLLVDVNNVAN